VDFERLAAKQYAAMVRPAVGGPADLSNFSAEFTAQVAAPSALASARAGGASADAFAGFTFDGKGAGGGTFAEITRVLNSPADR
jgi:hypothetical protein